LIVWMLTTHRSSWTMRLGRVAVPTLLVLSLTGVGLAYYNAHLTGNPLTFPYQHNGATYSLVPLFVWQPLGPEPSYRHREFHDYHLEWAKPKYLEMQTAAGYLNDVAARLKAFCSFFFGIGLLVPLLALPWTLRNPWMRIAGGASGLLLATLIVTTWFQPHYAAPIVGVLMVLTVQGLRHLALWRWHGFPVGRWYVLALPVVYLALMPVALGNLVQDDGDAWYEHRARLLSQLEHDDERHVVIVRYGPDHSPLQEWVYNRADIDAAKVIWARDMGEPANRRLFDYFGGRRFWLLLVNDASIQLTPLPSEG